MGTLLRITVHIPILVEGQDGVSKHMISTCVAFSNTHSKAMEVTSGIHPDPVCLTVGLLVHSAALTNVHLPHPNPIHQLSSHFFHQAQASRASWSVPMSLHRSTQHLQMPIWDLLGQKQSQVPKVQWREVGYTNRNNIMQRLEQSSRMHQLICLPGEDLAV